MIKYKNLTVIPSYHSNLDFVHEVRYCFFSNPPDIIAVEFPENLKLDIINGVGRLPKISIVLYFDELLKQQLYVPITPADSLIEGVRLSLEYGIPIKFIDLFVKDYNPELFNLPDSYVLNELTLDEYYNILKKTLKLDIRAELKYQKAQLEEVQKNILKIKEGNLTESESSSKVKVGADAQDWLSHSQEIDLLRDHYMATRLHELMEKNKDKQILVIIGLAHWERIKNLLEHNKIIEELSFFSFDVKTELFNVEQENLPKIMVETPNVVFQFENFRRRQNSAINSFTDYNMSKFELLKFDYSEAIKKIIAKAVVKYKKQYNESLSIHKIKSLFQFMRNLSLLENMLKPLLFDIVLASKSIINDDFAWLIWEECKYFPSARSDHKLETLNFTENGIFLHGKHFKIRRNIPLKIQKIKLPLKPKPKEKRKGEWRKTWNKNRWNLVSHLPEDIFEENYFQHVRKRSLNILKDQYTHTLEFISTLLDGIDFRETLRNWPIKHKIYVKEERPLKGDVDAVVIIFNRDLAEDGVERYPHAMMWYAEHQNESDLAFYSTFPGVDLVGPGISRIELGGVTSFFPPRGILNIWSKEFHQRYPIAKNKPDKLLTAALVFAQKKFVTYVAEKKPDQKFYQISKRLGIKLLFIPLDRFNPVSLRALRNLHVLAGKHIRLIAKKYIKKRRI